MLEVRNQITRFFRSGTLQSLLIVVAVALGVAVVTAVVAYIGSSYRQQAILQSDLSFREITVVGRADDPELFAGGDPLPRLMIVIDEFRMLAEEQPDVMAHLMRIAAVGRSLGVHLVLATQRPGGIVSADIKANVNLRIALRVRDRADSDDVIGCPDAAALCERVLAAGLSLFLPLEERWYRRNLVEVGARQFIVADPDGYLLRLSTDIGTRPGR